MDGERKIKWARDHMPVMEEIRSEMSEKKTLKGQTVGMALHVEPKTAVLVETLRDAGAEVYITGCNPLSTQDDVSKALDNQKGITSYAKKGVTRKEYYKAIDNVIDKKPDITVDDGGDLVFRIHRERPELIKDIQGGTEETTTGVHRLRAMDNEKQLKYPVIAVNDTPMKRHFDNIHGTGESTISAITATTNIQISGKQAVVAGYGYCGRGVAQKLDGLGARVTITETDPNKALEAVMDGFEVEKMNKAIQKADILITTTGNRDVVRKEHLEKINDGALLANSGHFNVEIDIEAAEEIAVETNNAREGVIEYKLKDGRKFYIIAEGRLVNLAAPQGLGHPIEVMDLSFAIQALSIQHIHENQNLKPKVHNVPTEIDRKVAKNKLKTMNIEIDQLTDKQKQYLESWDTGT
ncbi:S-adenosylhomocysteine hydrolase [Methanonatronarchaeum thermophilum]|uniref:Adenosylhomocysteinase n=1 Tax=Methanonatronarchaeum thermophilum TaxID=1927129 RepID=A0A1Y3GB70_9EURY|nr:adenosylhomocysteinase [Methanonatronarchaeum thermophilum]OUJ18490.1 S-adenosylhomocysteine hydrolase [Methanonatronarchaeum thermophilum]